MSKLSVISLCVLLSYVASYESSGENYEPEEFASECLTAHNYYRKLHGTPMLTLSNDLNRGAQKYADYLARKMHIPHQLLELNVGQNLAWNESLITAEFATELWYREEKYFVYNSKRYLAKTENFNKVIGKNSKQLGCAIARDKFGASYVVSRYYPKENALKLKESKTTHFISKNDTQLNKSYDEITKEVSVDYIEPEKETTTKVSNFSNHIMISNVTNSTLIKSSNKKYRPLEDVEFLENFSSECLLAHNFYRRKHNSPDLKLSQKLNAEANKWAKNLIELGVDYAIHSPDTTKGESLAWSEGTLSAAQAVTNWYNDFNLFQVGHPQFYEKADHLRQVLWNETTHVGCGVAIGENGESFVVARYFPRAKFWNLNQTDESFLETIFRSIIEMRSYNVNSTSSSKYFADIVPDSL